MQFCTWKLLGRKAPGYLGYFDYYCCLGNPHPTAQAYRVILHDDDITQQDVAGNAPMQRSLNANNTGATAATCKGQILENVPELLC
jgi:hypothetical protein